MSQFELDAFNDISKFVDNIITNQKNSVVELVEEMENRGDKSCKFQLHRHLNILLSMKSTMEDFI